MSNSNASHKGIPHSPRLTLQTVRNRVTDEIAKALGDDQPVLIEALPGTGKSHGVVKAVKQIEQPVTVFTCRGRKEQYNQYQQWAQSAGLSTYILPSVYHDCPTANGDHGKEAQQEVMELLENGVSPTHIHRRRDLPCQKNDQCRYIERLNINPDQYDILFGHYKHAQLDWPIEDRAPVFDEFPGHQYFTDIKPDDITFYLQEHSRIPFDNFSDLVEHRDDDNRRRNALNTLLGMGDLRNESLPFRVNSGKPHTLSGLGVLTLLRSNNLGNGWEQARLGRGRAGLFDRERSTVTVFDPPDLPNNIVALDGTPTKVMWNLALGFYDQRGRSLQARQVLDDEERLQYVVDIQNITIIQTTTDARTYSSGTYVTPQRDAALVTAIEDQHGCDVGLISSEEGLDQLLVDTDSRKTAKYGNLLGSNGLGKFDVGVILGSPHYGNPFLKKWGALAGLGIESNGKSGMEKSYGQFGDQILRHMREHSVLQALFRFARNGDGATVYVDTGAIPDWVPVAANPSEVGIHPRPEGKDDIIQALEQLGKARTSAVVDETGLSPRHVRGTLNDLCQQGVVSKKPAPDGRGGAQVYVDDGLDRYNPFGVVDLPNSSVRPGVSELSPNNTSYGRVPKERATSLDPQMRRKAHEEAKRRENLECEQVRIEMWRSRATP